MPLLRSCLQQSLLLIETNKTKSGKRNLSREDGNVGMLTLQPQDLWNRDHARCHEALKCSGKHVS